MEQLALAIPATCCCSLRALGHATSRAGALPGRDGFALPGIGEVMGLTDQEPTTVDCSPTKVGCSPTKVGIEIFPAGNRQLSAGDFPASQCLITRGILGRFPTYLSSASVPVFGNIWLVMSVDFLFGWRLDISSSLPLQKRDQQIICKSLHWNVTRFSLSFHGLPINYILWKLGYILTYLSNSLHRKLRPLSLGA